MMRPGVAGTNCAEPRRLRAACTYRNVLTRSVQHMPPWSLVYQEIRCSDLLWEIGDRHPFGVIDR